MKMNRIQFQKGMSLHDFQKEYGSEEQCETVFEKMRWPKGYLCPKCGSSAYHVVHHREAKTFQCASCRAQSTLTGGTIFHSTKLPLTVWFLAIYIISQSKSDISALSLKRLLGVCYRTAWRIKHKLMEVMADREYATVLRGRVEVDDAYLGGALPGGKAGRGSENKVPFIAAVQTDKDGHPLYAVLSPVKAFTKEEVGEWAGRHIAPESLTVSDGLRCFLDISENHQREVVGAGRKSTHMKCFQWVNTLLGNVKNSITGTCHGFKFGKYIGRYLAVYQYRFNRRFNLTSILSRLLYACSRTGKRTEVWLRAV